MNREKIHALFGLLLNGFQDNPAIDIFDAPVHNDLVDRHRPERSRAPREQRLARRIEIAPRAQVHDRIRPGIQRRLHFF